VRAIWLGGAIGILFGCGQDKLVSSGGSAPPGGSAAGDSGASPAPCSGIAPPADTTMMQYVVPHGDRCRSGTGDGVGTLAFPVLYNLVNSHGFGLDFVTSSGVLLRNSAPGAYLDPLPQPAGFAAATGPGYLGPRNIVGLLRWDSGGNDVPGSYRYGDHLASAAAPAGGILVAGNLSTTQSGPTEHVAEMFTGGATPFAVKWGPRKLDSSGTVFGAGVDLLGRSLVITDGTSKYGQGTISGQWFDRDGTPLTGEFVLVSGFTPGKSTWFETSTLIGGGLLVRRMDVVYTPAPDAGYHALALVVVSSGATRVDPAPEWIVSRRDVRLQIARGGQAYAALPLGASNVACTQRLELLAPDGTSCGARDYQIAAGTCSTGDLTLGLDGTVIQQLPASMESERSWYDGSHTCTWRWWAGAVR